MIRKIKIGITVSINSQEDSLFSNGIKQNILILRELYEKCENIEKSFIINTSNIKITQDSSNFGSYAKDIISLEDAYNLCDLIVVCHGSMSLEMYKKFNSKGIKIVKLVLGAQQTSFTENILFNSDDKAYGIYKRNNFVSGVWMSEHYYENEKNFHEIIYGVNAKIAPYVWSPRFIEDHQKKFEKANIDVFYRPTGLKEKRISSFEPNLSIAKNLMFPLMIVEKFYRKRPDLLKQSVFFNASEIMKKKDFIDFAKDLDAHTSKKMIFQPGYPIVSALYKHTDIVLSHQTGNALNYLYLDAAWFGYPVLHNSDMMKNIGFYYEKNNVEMAIEQLINISKNFDNNYQEYLKVSRNNAEKYFIENKENIENYTNLIEEVMA